MKYTIFIMVTLLAMRMNLTAQGAAMSHVFPQIADGFTNVGTTYGTTIFATNVSSDPATCTLSLYGVPLSRLANGRPLTATMPTQGSVVTWNTTRGAGPLVTGYASLNCNRPVTAFALYFHYASAGPSLGGATVFSSPPSTRAQLVVAEGDSKTAIALANDTDVAAQYQLTITDAATGEIRTATVTVPARSNLPRFLAELVQLPTQFFGTLVITSSAGPFSVVGLLFEGNVFITLPASVY
jgi:hypothetical protein